MRNVHVTIAALFIAAVFTAAEKKLDYKQEQSLKDATYYLDQAEGVANALTEKTKTWKPGDTSIQLGTVENYTASKDKAVTQVDNADKRLKELPKDHSKVKPELERAKTVRESLEASGKKLDEFAKALGGVVAQGTGSGFKADFDRLQEMREMFNPDILTQQTDVAVEVIKQIPAVKDERKNIETKYADLLKQQTPQSKDLNGVLKYFDQIFGQFEATAKQFADDSPAQIDKNIADALKMADDAVKNNRPLYFREDGGVQQQLRFAQRRYDVFAALAPDKAPAAKQKIDDAREKVKQMKASLNDAIVAANMPPAEKYHGSDKNELVNLVKTKWTESHVPGDVMKTGINSQNWRRDTRWEYASKTWSKVDKSYLQGFVVVKTDDTHANLHYVNLVKDHMAEDKITAHHFEDPKAEPDVTGKLLVKNVK